MNAILAISVIRPNPNYRFFNMVGAKLIKNRNQGKVLCQFLS